MVAWLGDLLLPGIPACKSGVSGRGRRRDRLGGRVSEPALLSQHPEEGRMQDAPGAT